MRQNVVIPLSVIAARCHLSPRRGKKDSRTPKTVINISHSPLPPRYARHLRYTKTHFSCNEKCWSCYTRRVQGAGKKAAERSNEQFIYRVRNSNFSK